MIHHITREVSPPVLQPCLEFYGLLGFVSVSPPAGIGERAAWLRLGGTQLHLLLNPDAVPSAGHVAIVARDYESVLARLRSAGHPVEPRAQHWGSPRCYVPDPAGHLVELMAFGPDD